MAKLRKIVGLLALPFLLTGALALQINIVYAPDIVTTQELAENPMTIKVYVNPENVSIDYAKLTLTITDADQKEIYCRSEKNIEDLSVATVYTFRIYQENCYKSLDDGVYNIQVDLKGYSANQTITGSAVATFTVRNNLENLNYDLDILEIYPNFEKLKELSKGIYVIKIQVRNTGIYDLEGVAATLKVFDEYGNLVYQKSTKRYDLEDGEQREFDIVFDTTVLEEGKTYTLVIEVADLDEKAKEVREYQIKVVPGKVGELSLTNVFIKPFEIYPGDYVEITFYIRNNLGKEIRVTPIVISEDLGIYKELDELEFKPDELKKVTTVLKIPNYVIKGTYKVTLRLEAGDIVKTYDVNLYVAGEEKQLTLEISEPAVVKVEEENEFTIVIRSLKEKLWDLKVEAYFDKGDVRLEKNEVVFGGKGETYSVRLYVTPEETGKGKLTVVLRDKDTGEILAKKEVEINVIRVEKEKYTTIVERLREYVPYIVGLVVAVIAVIVFWLVYGKEEEERPSR